MGGVVEHETDAKIGEDGREYVIPITKPSRAIGLIRQAAHDLGMTVQTTSEAAKALGGSGEKNITPAYAAASTTNNTSVVNNKSVNAPATINVYGMNAESTARIIKRNQEQLLIRNIKSALT